MKILVFPKDENPNPYQELLYEPIRINHTVDYLTASNHGPINAALFVPKLIAHLIRRRLQGYSILHVHWLFTLGIPTFVPFHKHIAYIQTRVFLRSAKLLGFHIVWTAHNVLPHSTVTSNDLGIRKQLAHLSSAVIVHSTSTLEALQALGLSINHFVVIPHGNYIGVYANTVSMTQARHKLHIPLQAKVFGFVGAMHDYKNLPELVDAFIILSKQYSDLYLILAGKDSTGNVQEKMNSLSATEHKFIKFYPDYIADDNLQVYFNAADICVFPFSEITTSGSVLLATSFSKPIIAPYLGAIQDIPKTIGRLYDPTKHDALLISLDYTLKHRDKLPAMTTAAHNYAATLSWSVIANRTEKVYEEISHD